MVNKNASGFANNW